MQHNYCTVKRTFVIQRSVLNMATGKSTQVSSETVKGECKAPLFKLIEKTTGICDSCSRGWECADNKFSTKSERSRAEARTL